MNLELDTITKKYNANKYGVHDFSLEINAGILGLLGPNGAGKSTVLKMIATLSKPSSGSIKLNGKDIRKHPNVMRKTLGYLPQDFGVYPELTPPEFLAYIGAMKGLGGKALTLRVDALLEELNLSTHRKTPLGQVSGGMKQRVGIAQALLNDPEVLILDEPTVGLDPEERLRFGALLSDLAYDKIVLLSSHIVSDIESIADQVAIMNQGNLVAYGAQEEITTLAAGKVFETMIAKQAVTDFKKQHTVVSSYRSDASCKVRYIADKLIENSQAVTASLEDAFIYLTKQPSYAIS